MARVDDGADVPGNPVAAERAGRRPAPRPDQMFPFWDVGGSAYFGYRMAVAAKLFDRRIMQILAENGGLTLSQWRVLAQLGLVATGTVRSLADGAAVDRSEASRALRDLEALGLVSRTANQQDRRSPNFALTPAGIASFETTRQPVSRFINRLVEGVASDDLEAADRVLWRVTQGCLD